MVNEDANDLLEMAAVEDQEPIETLRANRPYESFRDTVCLGRAKRRANDLYPIALEDPVKTLGELLIPIANQEAERFLALRQRPRQLPGLLRHPGPAWIGCAPGEMHTTTAQLDEEEHVEPLQPDRLHGEEIDGEHTLPMRSYEFAPGRAPARADRTEATFPKPCAHGRRRHRDAESFELPNDALISPARVFCREPQHQLPNFRTNRRPAGTM